MKPISFHPKEVIYTSPEPEIEPLPALPISFGDGTLGIISCWKPSFRDVMRLIWGQPVYLVLLSPIQPPVLLSTDRVEVMGPEEARRPAGNRNGRTGA